MKKLLMLEFGLIVVFFSMFSAEQSKEVEQERKKRRRRRKAARRTEAKSAETTKQTKTQNATVPKSTPTQTTAPVTVTAQQPPQANPENQNSERPIYVVFNHPMYPPQMNAMEPFIPPDHHALHHGPDFPPYYNNRYPNPHHQNWTPHRMERPMGFGPSHFPPQFYRPPRPQPRFDPMHRPYGNQGPFNSHGQFNSYGPYPPYNNNNSDIRHSGSYYNNSGPYGGSYGQTRLVQVFPTEPMQPQPQLPPPANSEQSEEAPKKKKKKKKRKKKKKQCPAGADAESKTDDTIQATSENTVQDATPSTSKQGNNEKHAEFEKHDHSNDSESS